MTQLQLLPDPPHNAQDAYHAQYRAGNTWAQAADHAIITLANTGNEFTSDDVRALIPEGIEPTHANAWGGLFSAWQQRGLIRPTGFTTSRTKSRHAGTLRTWIGTATTQKAAA